MNTHVITLNLTTTLHHHHHVHGLTNSSHRYSKTNHRLFHSFKLSNNVRVFSELKRQNQIDYNDPDWKEKFKEDFEARFRLPHVTDIFPDASSMRSTFCLKMRFVILFLVGLYD